MNDAHDHRRVSSPITSTTSADTPATTVRSHPLLILLISSILVCTVCTGIGVLLWRTSQQTLRRDQQHCVVASKRAIKALQELNKLISSQKVTDLLALKDSRVKDPATLATLRTVVGESQAMMHQASASHTSISCSSKDPQKVRQATRKNTEMAEKMEKQRVRVKHAMTAVKKSELEANQSDNKADKQLNEQSPNTANSHSNDIGSQRSNKLNNKSHQAPEPIEPDTKVPPYPNWDRLPEQPR